MTNEHVEKAVTIPGWMLRDELTWLYDTASAAKSVLEIGSWMGRSTHVLCSACKGFVVAVDHFRGSPEHQKEISAGVDPYSNFISNLGHFTNLVAVKSESSVAAGMIFMPQKFDMVFIDGAHEYEDVVADLKLWGDRARVILCGHDGNYRSVQRALAECFPGREVGIVPGTTLWFYRVEESHETPA